MKIYNHVFVWLVILLPLIAHAFPKANKFDLVERFLPVMLIVFLIVVGCMKGWFFSWWKRRKTKEPGFVGPPKMILIPLILLVGWSAFSFVTAKVSTFGFTEIYMLFAGALVFLYFSTTKLTAREKKEEHSISFLEKYLPFGLTLLLTFSLIGGIYGFLTTDHTRFFGLFYNPEIKADSWPNAYALFFLLTFPLTIYWAFVQKHFTNHATAFIKILFIGILLGGFLMTFSRAGMLAFIIEMVILGIFLMHRIKPISLIKLWHIFIISILIAATSYASVQVLQTVKSANGDITDISERITFQESQGGSSFTERKEFFTGSMSLIKEEPLTGFGPSSFKWIYPHVQEGFLSLSDHPHNLIFKYATERGLPAVIFFLVFLFTIFIKTNPFSRNSTTFQKFTWAALLGALAHCMVDHNLNFISNYLIFWLLLSALAASIISEKSTKTTKEYSFLSHLLTAIFALTLIIILACSSVRIVKDSWHYLWLSQSFGPTTNSGSRGDVENYTPLLPRWTLLRLDDGYAKNEPFLNKDGEIMMQYPQNRAIEKRQILLENHLKYNLYDAEAYSRFGQIAFNKNQLEDALTHYAKAIEVNPKNTFKYYAGYARTATKLNNAQAIEELRPNLERLIEEYMPLYDANLHYTQRDNEMEYINELRKLLEI
jgi:O-antigen ligase